MIFKDIQFPANTKFLVTGGAGFIGSHLCEQILKLGYHVRCLDNISSGSFDNVELFINHPNYEFAGGDIRDLAVCKQACQGIDFVLHQAAWGSVPRSFEMPAFYTENNVQGTQNIFEAARLNKVKKVIYASSSSVYGDSPILPKKEGEEGEVLSPYALTKKINEEQGKFYTKHFDLSTIGLRYFNVFGPRQNPNGDYAAVIPKFINLLQENHPVFINGDGTFSRDFTYVENVVYANLKACLASENCAGKIFNIANCNRVDLNSLFNSICKIMQKTASPQYVKPRKGDIPHSFADISNAENSLGYRPKISFEDGLIQTIKCFSK